MHANRQIKGAGREDLRDGVQHAWGETFSFHFNMFMRMMNHGLAIVWPVFDDYDSS